jgi:drug/metabolite transporter (DMT)-like permease
MAFCLLASFAAGEPRALPAALAPWIPVIYLTLAGSIAAYGTFTWLVRQWPASTVSFIAVVVPVVALLVGAAARGERVTPAGGGGIVLVLSGVVIALSGRASGGSGGSRGTGSSRAGRGR